MIHFKTIRWQNLLSTGNTFTEVALDKVRTSLIIGTNGAGKSTILDALNFVLFNKPFRKVNKGQLINSITGKNLLVEIEFEKGGLQWAVRRGSKPNIFEIYKAGVLVDQNSENKDYQAYLETVLGMNQKAFAQVVILGAASFIPFMQLTVPARREVIEDLLDIQVFTDMNVLLKGRVSDNKRNLLNAENAVNNSTIKLNMATEFNKKQSEGNQHLVDAKQAKIEELSQAALETIEKLEAIQREVKVVDTKIVESLTATKRDLENQSMLLGQSIKTSEKAVTFLQHSDTCPTCKQDINQEFKNAELKHHETMIAIWIQQGKELKKNIVTIETKLNELFEYSLILKKQEAAITEYEREIGWYQKQVESITTEITELEKVNKKTLTDLAPLQTELEESQSNMVVVQETTKVLDAATVLLKDTGIKSVIIKQYIPVINSLINKYLAAMDFFVDFQISETFEETIKSRFRDEFSYESFSEGEKMRIDLAVLFSWRTVAKMRNSCATNLLIFDEVLDSSLDQYGIDEFIKIIQALTDQENIFIISHRGDSIGDKFDSVLKFTKVRGYSQLTEGV